MNEKLSEKNLIPISFGYFNFKDEETITNIKEIFSNLKTDMRKNDGKLITTIKYPRNVFICNNETFNYFLKCHKESYQSIQKQINLKVLRNQVKYNSIDFNDLLNKSVEIKQNKNLGFAHILEEGDIVTGELVKHKIKYEMNTWSIFIAAEEIKRMSRELQKHFFKEYDPNEIYLELSRFVILHEIGHVAFDIPLDNNLRMKLNQLIEFDEAYANFFAHNYPDNDGKKNRLLQRIMDIVLVKSGRIYHNYYHLLNHLDQGYEILYEVFNKNINEAIEKFYRYIGLQPFQGISGKSIFCQKGFEQKFPAFNSRDIELVVGSYTKGISCITGHSIICIPHINILEGFFPKETIIFSNQIDFHDHYDDLPNNIKKIPKEEFDIEEELKRIKDIKPFLKKLISKYGG